MAADLDPAEWWTRVWNLDWCQDWVVRTTRQAHVCFFLLPSRTPLPLSEVFSAGHKRKQLLHMNFLYKGRQLT